MEKSRELDGARAIFLEKLGDILGAAELHVSLRHTTEAVRLFKHTLAVLWQHLPFGTSCSEPDATLARSLEETAHIETKLLSSSDRQEVLCLLWRCQVLLCI